MTLKGGYINNYCSPNELPTGQDLERFLSCVPSTTQSRSKRKPFPG